MLRRLLPRSWWRRLHALAYPGYDCECCVGQEPWRGCYCAHHGCIAPCVEPTRWHLLLRKVVG